jgi:hypothetical protein
MRTLAFLFLASGFVLAVILPNEIGTCELPAVNHLAAKKADNRPVELPGGSGFAGCPSAAEISGVALISLCQSTVSRTGSKIQNQDLCLPLLI